MKKIFSFLAVAAFLVPGALSADECFSEKGIAANFVDILGKWKKSESRVEIDSIAGGLRFTFFTGVRERKFPVNPAKPDTPAVLGKESVEIQICPDPASGVYYHIGVNPSGTLYTARKRDTSWEPRQLKVDVKDWGKVIIEISYADLEQKKPAAGSAWKINFGHSRIMGSYSDHFSWAGVKSFHDYKNYGTLRFGTSPRPVVILEEQSSTAARARVVNGRHCTLELIENGKVWKGRFSSKGIWEFTPPNTMELPVKSSVERKFRLKDKEGRILWERTAVSGFDNRHILETDRYYYTPADKKLQWSSSWKGKKDFFLSGPAPLKWSSEENSGSVTLPAEPGRYLLTVRQGNCRLSRVVIITAAAPLMRNCSGKWEAKGEFLYCSGRRRFLVGGSQTKVLQLQHGDCFNTAHIVPGKLPGALEYVALRGKRLWRSPNGTGYVFPGDEAKTLEYFRKEALRLNTQALQISRIAYEAQMKSWLTVKGRRIQQDPAELYKKIYTEMKKHAPGQLFSLQIDRQKEAVRFAPACDVFEVAVTGSYHEDPMPGIAQEIRNIRKTVPGKILIHWFGVTVPNNFCRSAEELQAELYLAFLNNSAGVLFHLGHGFLPASRSRLWSVISSTAAELDEMMEEFHGAPALDIKEPAGFRCAVRDCGSYYLIIGVNLSNTSKRMKLELPGKKTFSALFNGFEPRVFRIRK